MKIKEVIENITEIQNPNWANQLSNKEIEKIEKDFWLIQKQLMSINEFEVIGSLLEISKYLEARKTFDNKVDFKSLYPMCIKLLPKKKYKFVYPKRKKSNTRDYEFLKLLSIELKESIHTCEDYYDIYEKLGILEKEKEKLFTKYTNDYSPVSSDIIEIVNINSLIEHPKRVNNGIKPKSKEYIYLLESIRNFGILEPIIVDKKTKYIVSGYGRYECCKEIGIQKVQVIKKVFNSDVLEIINFKLDNSTLLSEQVKKYHELRQEIKNLGYKDRGKLMGGLKMRPYLCKQIGISQTQVNRLAYIEKTNSEIYNKVLEGNMSINKGYTDLKKLNKTKK